MSGELDDLEIDVDGVPMPAWLMFRPDSVFTVTCDADDGRSTTITFEQFAFASKQWTVHCTWPRYSSMLTKPHPETECRWTHPTYDEEVLKQHALIHAQAHFAVVGTPTEEK